MLLDFVSVGIAATDLILSHRSRRKKDTVIVDIPALEKSIGKILKKQHEENQEFLEQVLSFCLRMSPATDAGVDVRRLYLELTQHSKDSDPNLPYPATVPQMLSLQELQTRAERAGIYMDMSDTSPEAMRRYLSAIETREDRIRRFS